MHPPPLTDAVSGYGLLTPCGPGAATMAGTARLATTPRSSVCCCGPAIATIPEPLDPVLSGRAG